MKPYGSKRSLDTEPRIKSARALVKREGEAEIEEHIPRSGFRNPPLSEQDVEALERAIVGWAVAIAARVRRTQAPCPFGASNLDCGGVCYLPDGHDPPCSCAGDVDGPGTCPA